jgi:hypothetical protein
MCIPINRVVVIISRVVVSAAPSLRAEEDGVSHYSSEEDQQVIHPDLPPGVKSVQLASEKWELKH